MSDERHPIQRPVTPTKPAHPGIDRPQDARTSGLARVPGAQDFPQPKQVDRTLRLGGTTMNVGGTTVNVTGFYEHVPPPNDADYPGFTMQINQAGRFLVGWVTRTPPFSLRDPQTGLVKKTAALKTRSAPTGFMTFIWSSDGSTAHDVHPRGYAIDVTFTEHPKPKDDPNVKDHNVYDLNVYDPAMGAPEAKLLGRVRVERRSDPSFLGVQPVKPLYLLPTWQVTGICFDAKLPLDAFDDVRQVSTRPRLPHSFIKVATPPTGSDAAVLRDELFATHIDPLPERHLAELLGVLTKLRLPSSQDYGLESSRQEPKSEVALARWLDSPPGPPGDKSKHRLEVIRYLDQFTTAVRGLRHAYHRDLVRSYFVDSATFAKRRGSSYYRLYSRVIADEAASQMQISKDSPLYQVVESGMFPHLTVAGNFAFRYTLSFSEVLNSNPLIQGLAVLLGWMVSKLPVNIGLATLDVKCEKVELEKDDRDDVKLHPITRNPVVKAVDPRFAGYDTTKDSKVKYVAVILSGGIMPRIPGEVETFSLLGDIQYSDFGQARLLFAWGKPIGDAESPYVSMTTPEIGSVEVTLKRRNDLTLSGGTAKLITIKNNVAQKVQQFGKGSNLERAGMAKGAAKDVVTKGSHAAAEGWLEDLRMKGFKSRLQGMMKSGSISIGGGYIWEPTRRPDVAEPPISYPIPETAHISLDPLRESLTFFKQDEFDIDKVVQNSDPAADLLGISNRSRRAYIEVFMAKYLALLANPNIEITLDGHASPEGPGNPEESEGYNLGLSIARGQTVATAMSDAMKPYYSAWASFDDIKAHGEEMARSKEKGGGALEDPPDTRDVGAFKKWAIANKGEVNKWPLWRRVDVDVSGVVQLSLVD